MSTAPAPTPMHGDPMWNMASSLLPGLSSTDPSLWTINIKNFVITVLEKVDYFLSWNTQFFSFLVMHQLYD